MVSMSPEYYQYRIIEYHIQLAKMLSLNTSAQLINFCSLLKGAVGYMLLLGAYVTFRGRGVYVTFL